MIEIIGSDSINIVSQVLGEMKREQGDSCPTTQYHDRRGRFSDRLASEQESDKDDGVPQEATRFFLSSPVLFPSLPCM